MFHLLALRSVCREGEIVRLHACRLTKVGPEVKHGLFVARDAAGSWTETSAIWKFLSGFALEFRGHNTGHFSDARRGRSR